MTRLQKILPRPCHTRTSRSKRGTLPIFEAENLSARVHLVVMKMVELPAFSGEHQNIEDHTFVNNACFSVILECIRVPFYEGLPIDMMNQYNFKLSCGKITSVSVTHPKSLNLTQY